jgi:hypothetical protein
LPAWLLGDLCLGNDLTYFFVAEWRAEDVHAAVAGDSPQLAHVSGKKAPPLDILEEAFETAGGDRHREANTSGPIGPPGVRTKLRQKVTRTSARGGGGGWWFRPARTRHSRSPKCSRSSRTGVRQSLINRRKEQACLPRPLLRALSRLIEQHRRALCRGHFGARSRARHDACSLPIDPKSVATAPLTSRAGPRSSILAERLQRLSVLIA